MFTMATSESRDGLPAGFAGGLLPALFRPGNVAAWTNIAGRPPTMQDLAGRVVLVEAFQMLCPGCVTRALPQLARVATSFPVSGVAVIGLHSVFEHAQVQGRTEALAAFLHEYRIGFPVAVDARDPGERLPRLMREWRLEGTPSMLVFDRTGRLAQRHFGVVDDLVLGGLLGRLIAEPSPKEQGESCSKDVCRAS